MNKTINAVAFFDLLDHVLTRIGRDPVNARGPQKRIIQVDKSDRVLQILAGPGSGKTEMLVWRVLYEMLVLGTPAEQILVTTFTRRAATELEVRHTRGDRRLLGHGRRKHRRR